MDPSAAEPNTAQHPPPPVQQWDDSPSTDSGGGVLDGFIINPDTKNALLSFITTGQASKDEVQHLYDWCLSGMVKEHMTGVSAPVNKGCSPSMAAQTSNEAMPTLPPTPATTEDDSPPVAQQGWRPPTEPPRDLKEFFINLHLSGKISPTDLEKLYNLSALAEVQQFAALIQSSESSKETLSEQESEMDSSGFGGQARQQHQFTRQMQQPSQPMDQQYFDLNGQVSPSLIYSGPFGTQEASPQGHGPSYITPAILDHQSLQMPAQTTSPNNLMFEPFDPFVMPPNISQLNGLPSPVATRASSQSEGSSTPNIPQANESTDTVICPLPNPDGTTCGKPCDGPQRYRSMMEHIRRAHPEKYRQGLPATEESFLALTQTGGIRCTIIKDNDVACDVQFSGNRRWRLIQDHVRDHHPENWVPDLPANEASYKILMTNEETADCPIPRADGKPCVKHTFGEKRWRSLQEHIRRAHPDYYISGLHATEESIQKMCEKAGVTLGPSRRAKKPSSQNTNMSTQQQRPQQQINTSELAGPSTETLTLQEQAIAASPGNAQQAFESPYFSQQVQTTAMQTTLAPAALESDVFSPSTMAMSFPPPQEPYQTMLGNSDLFLSSDFSSLQHQSLGLDLTQSVVTPTAQNLDQTLSPELFRGQSISGHQQAMHQVYGDSYTAGSGQFVQPSQSLPPLQGMQPIPLQQPIQHSQPDAFLCPTDSIFREPLRPDSLSLVNPLGAQNIASSIPHPLARKRKASLANGLDSKNQSQPTKKTSLGKNSSASASAQQTGAPISPINLAPSVQSQPFTGPSTGTVEFRDQSAQTRMQAELSSRA